MTEPTWQVPPKGIVQGWRAEIKGFAPFLNKDVEPTGEQVGEAARAFHTILEEFRTEGFGGFFAEDVELEEISDQFHTVGFVDKENADINECSTILEALYDWADENRVWIDPFN